MDQRILDQAYDKFLRDGFYKTSMDSLVKDLRTSKSSLYNHYKSKDDLVEVVLKKINNEINHTLNKLIYHSEKDFQWKFNEITRFTKQTFNKVSEQFLKDLELSIPELWEFYEAERKKRVNKYYRKLFQTGIEEGALRKDLDIDIVILAYLNLTAVPLQSRYVDQLGLDNERIYENIQELFLNGILKR